MASFAVKEHRYHYWVVDKSKLIAGPSPIGYDSYVSKQYLNHLLDMGVRTFISLQEEDEVMRKTFAFYHDALERLGEEKNIETSFIRMPFMDGSTINSQSLIHLLDMIDGANRQGHPAYVHCMAGHGRTGTVVGCWLVRHGLTGSEALRRITELRSDDEYLSVRKSPQKPGQCEKVRSWRER